MQSGWVFNIQRYSVHDGPGIRSTVFLKGCPLRCRWCHNPEGQAAGPEIMALEGHCLACGECRAACPFGPAIDGSGALPVHHPRCTLCGACVDACPSAARQRVGREMTVAHVVEEVLKDRVFYDESGGGVSFSGGEPLTQPDFLKALAEACHGLEIHTAVDTCGYGSWESLRAVSRFTDLFLYDLKVMDDAKHREVTGVSNAPILSNLRSLGQVHGNIWIRVPIVPGINDSAVQLEALARFASSIPGVQRVNLLPYHRAGAEKSRRLGLPNTFEETRQPSAVQMEEYADKFRSFGLQASAGG